MKKLYIDMDSTLMDFSKGDLDNALQNMKYPEYYSTVEPYEDAFIALNVFHHEHPEVSLNIVSGIPDKRNQGKYLPFMLPKDYNDYFDAVAKAKYYKLMQYFGPNFFDTIEFTKASQSKAKYIRDHHYLGKSFDAYLIDDYIVYVHDWNKLGGHGIWLGDGKSFQEALDEVCS